MTDNIFSAFKKIDQVIFYKYLGFICYYKLLYLINSLKYNKFNLFNNELVTLEFILIRKIFNNLELQRTIYFSVGEKIKKFSFAELDLKIKINIKFFKNTKETV